MKIMRFYLVVLIVQGFVTFVIYFKLESGVNHLRFLFASGPSTPLLKD